MNGWWKFYRQSTDNEIWKHDLTAWHVFETLLCYCNEGKWNGGRYQLAALAFLNPNTTYKALLRLKKAEMVTLSSNTKYSEIYICKWKEYQHASTTKREQPSNNEVPLSKESKNKEEYIHLKLSTDEYEDLETKFPLKDVKNECLKADDWLANSTKRYKDYAAFMRNWLRKTPNTKDNKTYWTPPNKEGLDKLKTMKEGFGL